MKPQGNPGEISGLAGQWQSAGDTLSQWQGQLDAAIPTDWSGEAATAFRSGWDDLKGKMGRGVTGLHGANGALNEFSRNLGNAQGEWGRAASAAQGAGLALADDGTITKGGTQVGSVDGGPLPGADPTAAQAAAGVINVARTSELDAAAAQKLAAAKFEAVASIAYGGDLKTAMDVLGYTLYGVGGLSSSGAALKKGLEGLEATAKKAESAYKDALAAAQIGRSNASELGAMMHSSDPAERSFAAGRLRQAGQEAKALFSAAGDASAGLDGARAADAALRDPAWSKFLSAVEVGRGIPVVDIVANGLSFGLDMAGGNSWQEAATRTGLSYAGGVGAVMLTGALMTPGVGEVVVAGLAAGAVAYGIDMGVQYVWNHWSGISHGISSAAHSVGHFFSSIF